MADAIIFFSFPSFQLIYFCFLPFSLWLSIYRNIFTLFLSRNKTPLKLCSTFHLTLFSSFSADISVKALALMLLLQLHLLPKGRMLLSLQLHTLTHTLQCTTSFIKNKTQNTLPTPAKAKNSFTALLLIFLLSSCLLMHSTPQLICTPQQLQQQQHPQQDAANSR